MKAKKFLRTLRLLLSWAPRPEAAEALIALQKAAVSSRAGRLKSAGAGAEDPVAAKMLKVCDGIEDLVVAELVSLPSARENYHKALAGELLGNQVVWAAVECLAAACVELVGPNDDGADPYALAAAELCRCAVRLKEIENR